MQIPVIRAVYILGGVVRIARPWVVHILAVIPAVAHLVQRVFLGAAVGVEVGPHAVRPLPQWQVFVQEANLAVAVAAAIVVIEVVVGAGAGDVNVSGAVNAGGRGGGGGGSGGVGGHEEGRV